MTKDDVKLLCETDPQLQWWAMVLFAEICDAVANCEDKASVDPKTIPWVLRYVFGKVDEFPRLVVHEQLSKAKESIESPDDEELDAVRMGGAG